MFDVVIAKYKEPNLSSLIDGLINNNPIRDVYIYDKSGESQQGTRDNVHYATLPNVGREAHTFLHHICEHYHELPDHLACLQANPWDHIALQARQLGYIELPVTDTMTGIQPKLVCTEKYPNRSPYKLPVARKAQQLFGITDPIITVKFSAGAQYVFSRACLLARPKEFYENLRDSLVTFENRHAHRYKSLVKQLCSVGIDEADDEIDAWTMERMWPFLLAQPKP